MEPPHVGGSGTLIGRCRKGQVMRKHGHCGSHGHKTPTYYTWEKMMERCYNRNHKRYDYYGRRGIKVCLRWHTFSLFLKSMGKRPTGTTLDRKNPNKHYHKRNCKWSTPTEQNNNQLRHFLPHLAKGSKPIVCGCGVDNNPCAKHSLLEIPF